MEPVFITGSADKFAEASAIIPGLLPLDMDLPEIQSLDPREVIAAKLKTAAELHDGPLIVEDTSLSLEALGGELPGPLIKWFMKSLGAPGLWEIADARDLFGAEARTWVGYRDERGEISFFEGSVKGTIVEPSGAGGFGWDPIFQPEGLLHSFAAMTPQEKHRYSMRRIAFEKLAKHLSGE